MKYDLEKQLTRGVKRTLLVFKDTMFELLAEKEFEKITVQNICKISGFPRSTFYNYFDDKYDLLEYCWLTVIDNLSFEEHINLMPKDALNIYFDRAYQLFYQNKDLIQLMKKNNPLSGYLWNSFNYFIKRNFYRIFKECKNFSYIDISKEIISLHYANTILLFLDLIFIQNKNISREEAKKNLNFILSSFLK